MENKQSQAVGITLKYETFQKRIWFEVEDDQRDNFSKALKGIHSLGEKSSNWNEFLEKVTDYMRRKGFNRIPK